MTGVEDESSGVGVKVGSQRARPGIKMWQLNKRAQVKRSFQSDPSVWRWSWLCPTPPPPPAAAAALPLSASLKSRAREKHDCACLCLWLLCVQLWMYVSVYIWAKRGKATDLVFLIVRSHFSVSLLLSVPLFYLPSPPFFSVQESSQSWWHFQFLFFVSLSHGDLFALHRSRGWETQSLKKRDIQHQEDNKVVLQMFVTRRVTQNNS